MDKLIGMRIVGYRFGEAPQSGRSYNYRENEWEPGVSMASVGFDKEIGSFAVSEAGANRKKFYYVGTICGTGGDDEICLKNVQRITYQDYVRMRKSMVDASNAVVNARIDRSIRLINAGWNLLLSIEDLESERAKYLR